MFILSRDHDRCHVHRDEHDLWLSFYPRDPPQAQDSGLGGLATLDETVLRPGGAVTPEPVDAAEVVVYVTAGALALGSSPGDTDVIHTGEFLYLTARRRCRYTATSVSAIADAHTFWVTLHPVQTCLDRPRERKRFSIARRHNQLCPVASRDGRLGSLRTVGDVLILSSLLDPGHHVAHELQPGRSAWLHVVSGQVAMDDLILSGGDGVGVVDEVSVSLIAHEPSEILLVDVTAVRPS